MQKSSLLGPVLLVLAACSDSPVQPFDGTSEGGLLRSAASQEGRPTFVSNQIKYRDQGMKASTGRDGGSSMTVRALLGKNGKVDVDITTGTTDDLDRKTGPGNLDKLQLKVLGDDGSAIATQNYTRLNNGGFASYAFQGTPRGTNIQVQGNVSGVERKRVGVVTVTDAVKLRPDLVAEGLSLPSHAAPDVPVTIAATILEINGDVGARADCVLYVDGSEVDRATGIWVDAGGNVNCAFTHKFTSPGAKKIEVAAAKVLPADFEPSNNSVTGSLEVSSNFKTSGNVSTALGSYSAKVSGWREWSTDGGATFYRSEIAGESSSSQNSQNARQTGYSLQALQFPVEIEFSQSSNGRNIVTGTFSMSEAEFGLVRYESSSIYGCTSRSFIRDDSGRTSVFVCTSSALRPDGERFSYTQLTQERFAGEVTYVSDHYTMMWYEGENVCGVGYYSCYTNNYTSVDKAGTRLPTLGADYTLSIGARGGDVSLFSTVKVPLEAYSVKNNIHPGGWDGCLSYEDPNPGVFYKTSTCFEGYTDMVGVRGTAVSQ